MLNLKQLEAFVRLAEIRNFRKAAERLHITTPALSLRVKQLERSLDTELFTRGQNVKTELTPSGGVLYQAAKQILSAATGAINSVKLCHSPYILRIGLTDEYLYTDFFPIMAAICRSHASLSVSYQLGTSHAVAEAVNRGELDLACVCFPVTVIEKHVEMIKLDPMPMVAAVPSDHAKANLSSIWLRDLHEDRFLVPNPQLAPAFSTHVNRLFARAQFSPSTITHVSSTSIALELVANRLGSALLAVGSVPGNRKGVNYLSLKDRQSHIELGILVNSNLRDAGISTVIRSILGRLKTSSILAE